MPETHWSLIGRAEDGNTVMRHQALSELLRRYMPALKAHLVVEKRLSHDLAEDILQGFVLDKVLEQSLLAAANRARGLFRNFLLTALDRYATDQRRHNQAGIRHSADAVSLEVIPQDLLARNAPVDDFDIAWARQLLQNTLDLMQAQCQEMQRPEVWDVFNCRVLQPLYDHATPPTYEELVARFGFNSPTQACNALTTGKRMFTRILRSQIGEYETPEAVDAEILDLHKILAQPGARFRPI